MREGGEGVSVTPEPGRAVATLGGLLLNPDFAGVDRGAWQGCSYAGVVSQLNPDFAGVDLQPSALKAWGLSFQFVVSH